MVSNWQFIPNSILDEERRRNEADDWALRHRAELAQQWATRQRAMLAQESRSIFDQVRATEATVPVGWASGYRGGQVTPFLPTVTDWLGRPQQATFGAVSAAQKGEDLTEGARRGLMGEQRVEGEQLLEQAGMQPGLARSALGLGLNVVADPLNVVPVGWAGKALKGTELAGKAGRAVEELGEAGGRLAREVAPAARRLAAEETGAIRLPSMGAAKPTSTNPATQKLFDMYYGKRPTAGPSTTERLREFSDWFIRNWTDRNVNISRFQDMAERAKGGKLTADEMADVLIRLNPDKAAEVHLKESLRPALQSVGEDQPWLSAYLTHQNNVDVARAMGAKAERAALGTGSAKLKMAKLADPEIQKQWDTLNSRLDPEAAKAARAQIEAAARAKGEKVAQERAFSGGLRVADSEQALADMAAELGPERMQRVEQAANQIHEWVDTMRQRLVDSGVWSEEFANEMRQRYPHYAPTKILDYMAESAERAGMPAGRSLSLKDRGLRQLTIEGTERAREDPINSLVRLAYQTEAMARKNDTFNAFVKLRDHLASVDPEMAARIREVPTGYTPVKSGASAEHIITGYQNGKKVTYAVPKELGLAYEAGERTGWAPLRLAMTLFKMGATSRNPVFLASNALIDAMTYMVRESSRGGGPQALPRVVAELGKAYVDAFKGLPSGTYKGQTAEFLKGGGGMFGFFQGKPADTARLAAGLAKHNAIDIKSKQDLLRTMADLATLKPVEAIGERIELAPRVASYSLAQRRGAEKAQAVVAGRSVTIDFAQGGEVSKLLNEVIPFFNVGMQAPAQIVRAFRENPRGFAGTVVSLLAAPTVAVEAWNRSDPQRATDYEDVPQYLKDQGLVIMLPGEAPIDEYGNRRPQFVMIRTREFTPFVTLTREATRRAVGEDPRDWADLMGRGILTTVSPVQGSSPTEVASGLMPPVAGTGFQLVADKDLYRNRMIGTKYGDEQASVFSKALAERLGVRPSQVEFAIQDIGSGVAGMGLDATDIVAGEQKMAQTPQGIPGVGGLVGRFVKGNIGERLEQAQQATMSDETRRFLAENGLAINIGPVGGTISNIPLTMQEQAEYQERANQKVDEVLRAVASIPKWATLPAETKEQIVRENISFARELAASEILKKLGGQEIKRRLTVGTSGPGVGVAR